MVEGSTSRRYGEGPRTELRRSQPESVVESPTLGPLRRRTVGPRTIFTVCVRNRSGGLDPRDVTPGLETSTGRPVETAGRDASLSKISKEERYGGRKEEKKTRT